LVEKLGFKPRKNGCKPFMISISSFPHICLKMGGDNSTTD
jgi:hypothetical protein